MRIYLVGFMGAGKTTVGRELASRIGIPFFDLDELVEASEKKSVKEIFADRGEPYFRKRERDVLLTTRYLERGVIATGGGTFTFEENIQFIKNDGISIYLAAPFQMLMSRIGDKAAERPMFRDTMAAHELYMARQKFYRLADFTHEVKDDQTAAETAERLLLLLPRPVVSGAARKGERF